MQLDSSQSKFEKYQALKPIRFSTPSTSKKYAYITNANNNSEKGVQISLLKKLKELHASHVKVFANRNYKFLGTPV